MGASTVTRTLTMRDLLALPDDSKKRWIIDGELREEDMTRRNRFHSIAMANIAGELYTWRNTRPEPRGNVVCGEAAVQLGDDPSTGFGVDVAYVPPEVMILQTDEHTILQGLPNLIVEILSPSTLIEDLDEKVDLYLKAGVPLVWIVDPHDRTVTVYRPGQLPSFANANQDLSGGDVLPEFSVRVSRFFE